jgi:integrase
MSRRSKGAHYWLERREGRADTWVILDGTKRARTGLGADASAAEKDAALKDYLVEKHTAAVSVGVRDPSQIAVADVLAKYLCDKERPYETILRVKALAKFWSDKRLSEVTGDNCRSYAATRSQGAARRELEDLRAAINHHRREGLCDKLVSVVLPPKGQHREDYLTRSEAAALIWHAWRYREKQNHRATDRHTRRHVARFMVVARYMGSRAGVICEASIEPKRPDGRAWVDLKTGMFYGLPRGHAQTRKRRQVVRVPGPLLAHLRRWAPRQRHVVEWNGDPVLKVRKAHDAVVKAVLGRHVSPHIWRHTVATWLMQRGADRFEAANHLAMSVETLDRVYGHFHPDNNKSVTDAL